MREMKCLSRRWGDSSGMAYGASFRFEVECLLFKERSSTTELDPLRLVLSDRILFFFHLVVCLSLLCFSIAHHGLGAAICTAFCIFIHRLAPSLQIRGLSLEFCFPSWVLRRGGILYQRDPLTWASMFLDLCFHFFCFPISVTFWMFCSIMSDVYNGHDQGIAEGSKGTAWTVKIAGDECLCLERRK